MSATTAVQPALPFDLPHPIDGVTIKPTVAMLRGDQVMRQCGQCGLAVCVADCGSYSHRDKLGPCPRCGCATWWRQEGGIGGFTLHDDAYPEWPTSVVEEWLTEQGWTRTARGEAV